MKEFEKCCFHEILGKVQLAIGLISFHQSILRKGGSSFDSYSFVYSYFANFKKFQSFFFIVVVAVVVAFVPDRLNKIIPTWFCFLSNQFINEIQSTQRENNSNFHRISIHFLLFVLHKKIYFP